VAKNFCSRCGASIVGGQTFCSQCGNRVTGDMPASQEAASTPVHSVPADHDSHAPAIDARAHAHQPAISWGVLGAVFAACALCVVGFLVFNGLRSHAAAPAAGIHAVDFMNRTYETDCGKNVDPVFGNAVTVSNGRWVTTRDGEQFGFQIVKVVYGDLDGAGQEDAVVEVSCYRQANNWDYRQVYVFAASPQGAQLRASTDADSFSEVGIENGRVAITSADGGSRACPDWNVTNGFRVVGNRLVQDGVIRRTRPDCYQPPQGQQPPTVPPVAGAAPAAPAANGAMPAARRTILTPAQIAAVNALVVRNGGLAVTVPAFVNGTRSDGLNLHSTVAQLYASRDVPLVLAGLLRQDHVPTSYTIEQAFILLSGTAIAPGAGSNEGNRPTEVMVPGNQPWTASGVLIQVGETLTISATGGVSFSAGSKPSPPAGDLPDCLTVANGPYGWRASPFVANALPCSSLLGRIGETGAIFYIGAGTTFKAGASGQLYFGVNDNSFGDNSGHWTVEVSVSGSVPPAGADIGAKIERGGTSFQFGPGIEEQRHDRGPQFEPFRSGAKSLVSSPFHMDTLSSRLEHLADVVIG
jgi:hypothetical protein